MSEKARVGQAPPAGPPLGFASRPSTLGGGGPAHGVPAKSTISRGGSQLGHAGIQ